MAKKAGKKGSGSKHHTEKKSQNGHIEQKSSTQNSDQLPEYLQTLLVGNGVGLAEKQPYPFTKPKWFDLEKFRRGQKFAMDHIFTLMFSTGMSVILAYAYQTSLQPIIFTRNSSNPFTAFKRYLATIRYIKSWYEYDVLEAGNEGHKNMKSVRGMHERVKKRMITASEEEVRKKITNEGEPMWTDLHKELMEDFSVFPAPKVPVKGPNIVHLSQTDMAITQFAFTGLILNYPKVFGIHNATREDFEAFIHLWRMLGHLLGIEDRFNICDGDLETVQQRFKDLTRFWLTPSLRTVSKDWVHMSRCMMEGLSFFTPGASFEGSIAYLFHRVLQIPAINLKKSMSFRQKFLYWYNVYFFKYIIRIPGVFRLFNFLFGKKLDMANKKPADELKKLESKVYPYETAGKCPMMN